MWKFAWRIERLDETPCTPSGVRRLPESDTDFLSDDMYHFAFDDEDY